MRSIITVAAILVAGGLTYALWPNASQTPQSDDVSSLEGGALADVLVPETLSQNAQIGLLGYEVKCAACHGACPLWRVSHGQMLR